MPKEIELSKGLVAIVDDDDFDNLDQYYWFAAKSGLTHYAVGSLSRKPTDLIVSPNRKRRPKGRGGLDHLVPMHRFVLAAPDDTEVDHINGNGLDNRRSNLRLASRSENMKNRRVFKSNKLGHKGIHFEKATGRYQVIISVSYPTLEEAVRERDRIFQLVHGSHFNPTTASTTSLTDTQLSNDHD
jgi:hypothetical protein